MNKNNISIESLYSDYWTELNVDDTINPKEVAGLYNDFMDKLQVLTQFCDVKKIKYREDIHQYYIYVNRKQFTANSKRILIDKLYHAYCQEAYTLEQAYTDWMIWRRDIGTAPKTLQENANEWKRYIKNSKLSCMMLINIDNSVLEDFYYSITKDFSIDNKRLTNINSVLNGIFNRCISQKHISHNPLRDLDMSVFRKRCKPKNTNKDNYTLEERKAILDYLAPKDDIYSLAISLSMYLCLRIGELLAIRPEDIYDGILHLNRSMRMVQYMNDDLSFAQTVVTNDERIKGNKDSGFREIPLTPKALEIVSRIRTLYPDNEFLLMNNGKQLIGDTFNEHLRRVCEELHIKYRSSHQIRFTVATMLYENGVPITQLSHLLGHSDTNTTWHYVRQSKPDNSTMQTMQAVLD